MATSLRIDMVFSYWIFLWYLLYILQIVNYSPKFAIGLGIIENIILLCLMFYFGTNMSSIIIFLVINLFIKIIPYYTLRKETIKIKNVLFSFILFIIYIIWLHINNKSLSRNLKITYDSLIHGKNKTPLMNLFHKIKKNYINKL
jgi:hypothetical protein